MIISSYSETKDKKYIVPFIKNFARKYENFCNLTYQVSNYFIGEGNCEYLSWDTFDKSDGHRLEEVIDTDRFDSFVREQCDLDDAQIRLSEGFDVAWRFSFGLTTDSLQVQYFYAPGIVETLVFDMKTAHHYLSAEAKKLHK